MMKHPTQLAILSVLLLALTLASTGLHANSGQDHHHDPHDHHDVDDQADAHDVHIPDPNAAEHDHAPQAGLDVGRMIYEMSCIYCHGSRGRGDGGAAIFLGPYSHPRPNDFTRGSYKFRSTSSGELPMLTDLMRTIREGIPGFMPSYRNLGEDGIRLVAAYLAFEFIRQPLPEATTPALPDYPGPAAYTAASVRRGGQWHDQLGCAACHGADGRGAMGMLRDERGLHIMPMDLTRPEMFGNGNTPEDLYRTLMTGLDGTPMPSYEAVFRGREDEVWDLVHYILSLRER